MISFLSYISLKAEISTLKRLSVVAFVLLMESWSFWLSVNAWIGILSTCIRSDTRLAMKYAVSQPSTNDCVSAANVDRVTRLF